MMKQTAEVLQDKPLPSIGGFLYLVLAHIQSFQDIDI
jgi:hypothetical protein